MGNRSGDWLNQAEGDLKHAANARKDGDYDWSCFAAQQAGEKAVEVCSSPKEERDGGTPSPAC